MFTILGTKDATVNRADIELLLTELCSSGVDRPYTDKDVKYIMCYTAVAAAAKSLQSCLTLCDPTDGSPPGSAVPGIDQARTLE